MGTPNREPQEYNRNMKEIYLPGYLCSYFVPTIFWSLSEFKFTPFIHRVDKLDRHGHKFEGCRRLALRNNGNANGNCHSIQGLGFRVRTA